MANELNQIDLYLTRRLADHLTSDREEVDLQTTASGDLLTISGTANLRQAVINRLLTHKGELAKLGHPGYGSRLYQLIGEPNNALSRGLAELYIRESLSQEPRIAEIRHITFAPPSRGFDRDTLHVTIAIKPVGGDQDVAFTLSINLEG